MSQNNVLRIGLLGCGNHAHTHAQAAALSDRLEIVACADLTLEQASAFGDKYHIPDRYDSLQAMVEGTASDILLFSTWPAQHLEQIREACELGTKAILCEKALAMSGQEADEIQRIAERSGALVVEALMYRHHPQIQKALQLVRQGAIGQICYIHGYFSSPARPDPSNWRHRKADGGGAMAAKGCYMIDALCEFATARPISAFSRETIHPETGVEVGHTATISFEGDIRGQFESNHRSAWREEIRVWGTDGMIVVPHAVLTKTQPRHIERQWGGAYESSPMQVERFDFEPVNSYLLQLENMHAAVFQGSPPVVPLADSVRNLHVTSALLKSAETGQEVSITLPVG